jgi:hypothetical protein
MLDCVVLGYESIRQKSCSYLPTSRKHLQCYPNLQLFLRNAGNHLQDYKMPAPTDRRYPQPLNNKQQIMSVHLHNGAQRKELYLEQSCGRKEASEIAWAKEGAVGGKVNIILSEETGNTVNSIKRKYHKHDSNPSLPISVRLP